MADNVPAKPTPPPAQAALDFPLMIQTVIDNKLDPASLQMLLTMYNQQQDRQAEAALNRVMAQAQSRVRPIMADAVNRHLGNRYATLGAMMDMLQPVLQEHDIRVSFDAGALPGEPPVTEGCVRVRIVIGFGDHRDRDSYLDEPVGREGSRGGRTQMTEQQAIGSAMTYAQRTLLRLKFNITTAIDDDDGEGSRQPVQGNGQETAQGTAQETAQTGPRQPQGNGTQAPRGWNGYDTSKWAETLCGRLGSVQSIDGLNATMSAKTIVDWLADPNGATADDRARIDAAKQAAINRLTPKQDAKPATPDVSPEAAALLAEIEVMTLTMIDALPTDPAFNQRLIRLPEAEQELVDAAIKAHARRLANGTAEHPDA